VFGMSTEKINEGDEIILGWENGLGTGTFVVLKVYTGDPIHGLLVRGPNGETWPARTENAKKVRAR